MLFCLLAALTRGGRYGATSTYAPITSAAPTLEPRQLTNETDGYGCGDGYGYAYGYGDSTNTSEDSTPRDPVPCVPAPSPPPRRRSAPGGSTQTPTPAPTGKVVATVTSALTLTGLTVDQAKAIGPALVAGIAKGVGVPESQV